MSPKAKSRERTVFGRRLEFLRKERGLTQVELAERSGISRGTIAYYEASAQNPTLESLRVLADFFAVPIHELVEDASTDQGQQSRLERAVHRVRKLSPARQRRITSMLEAYLDTE
jgi:transcriptional regulator with XRE-family HTH domain